MLSAVMLTGSSLRSVGSVVFPTRSLVREGWFGFAPSRVPCVVLVLASAFLHVKISVKVFRIYLGMVTSFWSTFVLGGGGVM